MNNARLDIRILHNDCFSNIAVLYLVYSITLVISRLKIIPQHQRFIFTSSGLALGEWSGKNSNIDPYMIFLAAYLSREKCFSRLKSHS